MDRSLSLDRLRLALGEVEGLPSAEELSGLLADAEVAMFTTEFIPSADLLRTAWYLHGIAASTGASERYSLERQRQAFAVSAHIFDLALAALDLERVERLRYTFAAQIGYARGALDPNALAVYRQRLGPPDDNAIAGSYGVLGLEIGTSLLAGRTQFLVALLNGAATDLTALEDTLGTAPTNTMFGAVASLVAGVRQILAYVLRGDLDALGTGRALLAQALQIDPARGDIDTRWVAALLLNWSDGLAASSVWSVLPPSVPRGVRLAFTLAPPAIVALWPPQISLIRADAHGRSVLHDQVKRAMLALPTSAGKTLLAQLLIGAHLAQGGTSVCYVAPTRSLCREVRASLERRLRYMNFRGRVLATDELFDITSLFGTPAVEVMTPERLAYLIRQDAGAVVARFGLFVIDEVHFVGDRGRGWTLESSLSLLHAMTTGGPQRIVVMSAAIGNRWQVREWLDGSKQGIEYENPWRGPRRIHAIYHTERSGVEDVPAIGRRLARRRYPLKGILELRAPADGRKLRLALGEPVGTQETYQGRNGAWKADADATTPFYKRLVPLVHALKLSGPLLVVSPTRTEASNLAVAIADGVVPTGDAAWLSQLCASRLGAKHRLVKLVTRGVAYHHASLPDEVLTAIEQAFAEGQLSVLVSTTTLTEGVNLPVRTVLISAQGTHGPEGYEEFITGSRLLNAIGRAGRAAIETEGWVVLARQRFEEIDFERLRVGPEDMPVHSTLMATDVLAALEEIRAQRANAIFGAAGAAASDFVSFVWLVSSLLEEAAELDTEAFDRYIQSTFAWAQMDEAQRSMMMDAAHAVLAEYQVTDATSRRRWGRTGLSLPSSRDIEKVAHRLAVAAAGRDLAAPRSVIEWLLELGVISELLAMSEAPSVVVRQWRSGPTLQGAFSMDALLVDWISGVEIGDLGARHLHVVTDEEYRLEQIGDIVTAVFENYLPWVLGVVLEWVRSYLKEGEVPQEFAEEATGFIRYGVDDVDALALVRTTSVGRVTARLVAQAHGQVVDTSPSLRVWLCGLGLSHWLSTFAPSPIDLRGLIAFARPPDARTVSEALEGKAVHLLLDREYEPELQTETAELSIDGAFVHWHPSGTRAAIQAEHVADAQAIRAVGLPLTLTFASDSRSKVEVSITMLADGAGATPAS